MIDGNRNGHGIADYRTCARFRFTETVYVLLETYQSRTSAPLQSMFTCTCFIAIREAIVDAARLTFSSESHRTKNSYALAR